MLGRAWRRYSLIIWEAKPEAQTAEIECSRKVRSQIRPIKIRVNIAIEGIHCKSDDPQRSPQNETCFAREAVILDTFPIAEVWCHGNSLSQKLIWRK